MTNSADLAEGTTRDIYGMPSFVSLAVRDVRGASEWFTGATDFIELFAMPLGDSPTLVHLRRWRYQDLLLRRGVDDADVGEGIQLSLAATYGQLDEWATCAAEFGATGIEGPYDTAWNTRDLAVTSPEDLRIVFTARRPQPLHDAAFTASMTQRTSAVTDAAPETDPD